MKFSLNSVKQFNERYHCTDDIAAIGVDVLEDKIGAQLGAIESVEPFGDAYKDVVIVKVVSSIDHPNADRLHVCMIDDGGTFKGDVPRGDNGYIQVVCGAPNVREGLTVAWLPPGSTVPETIAKDPFVLTARDIRGKTSYGMLASANELAISDNHDGILEMDDTYTPGTRFVDAFHLEGDLIFDIENKMFTHRPDCFGFLGISRELAGIQQMRFKSPDWYVVQPQFSAPQLNVLPLGFSNELPELVPRFVAVTMNKVKVDTSPVWLQIELAKVGLRPINNIVDLTNFFMLETGQPLHAYDYDKVKALSEGDQAYITVRNPKPGERIALLNGKTVTPRPEAIMIATNKTLIGIGGVMGGADTEVDDSTQNIILECANFDMYSVRRTSMEHGLFTDAVSRFNKGQSPLQNLAVIAKIVHEIQEMTGASVAGQLVDDNHLDQQVMLRQSICPPITITSTFINIRLGSNLTADLVKQLLENVEFKIEVTDQDNLTVTAPFWRTDIELREDIVEEVGRLTGYDKLPMELPTRSLQPAVKDELLTLKDSIRSILRTAGANELLTYSFVHGELLEKTGQHKDQAFQLSNALSPRLQYYRLSLTPSLLEKVHPNTKSGFGEFALFELGKTHQLDMADEDGLPIEHDRLSLVYAKNGSIHGASFYQARYLLEYLLSQLHVPATFVQVEKELSATDAPYEPTRSAHVKLGNEVIGIVGEFKSVVRGSLKLPATVCGFEIDVAKLLHSNPDSQTYRPLSKFPKTEQDICLKVESSLPFAELVTFLQENVKKLSADHVSFMLSPIDIYQREDDQQHKQVTFRLSITSFDKTFTDAEINSLLDSLAERAYAKFQAERI